MNPIESTPPPAHPLDHKVPPPLLLLLTLAAMGIASRVLPPLPVPQEIRLVAALTLGGMALAIAGAGVRAFRAARTTIDPVHIHRASSLVESGIYRWTRNPMYLGMALLLLAWASWLASPWLLLAPLLFAGYLNRFQITPEERAMRARFPNDYPGYTQRVRRWA